MDHFLFGCAVSCSLFLFAFAEFLPVPSPRRTPAALFVLRDSTGLVFLFSFLFFSSGFFLS